jgi:hypothetical protein
VAEFALVIACMAWGSQVAHARKPGGPLVIWDFDHSLTNTLGGQYNVYGRLPSWSRTYSDAEVSLPSSRHSLRITAHREEQGYCGIWFEFKASSASPGDTLDASAYRYLSFWILGEKGGEDFDITLKDDTWKKHEDQNPTVSLHSYLGGGASTSWQQVSIPLGDFEGLNLHRLVTLVLSFNTVSDQRLHLDRMTFELAKPRMAARANSKSTRASLPAALKTPRALWVWETKQLIDPAQPKGWDQFLDFCIRQGISQVYLSLDLVPQKSEAGPRFNIPNPDGYRRVLEGAHRLGLTVEALAGSSEWAAEANHPLALAAVDAVLAFNRASPASARFDGIHFDVEPYLLVGYADPSYRPQLLKEFLEMISKCALRARTEGQIRFGCDVPAWFYPSKGWGRSELTVDFRGQKKTLGEHLTDLLDTVTLMDYRNEADGSGGMIAASLPAIFYAESAGKKIEVGVETSLEPERTHYFGLGMPLKEVSQRLARSKLRNGLYFGQFHLSTFSDDVDLHVGLVAPIEMDAATRVEFARALARLARELGLPSQTNPLPTGPILEEARAAIERDPEWKDFQVFRWTDPDTHETLAGFRAEHGMSPKVTFHGLDRGVFDEETRSVVEWLNPHASFAGLAIHYYTPFRKLVEGERSGPR